VYSCQVMAQTESVERTRLSRDAVVDGALALAAEAGMEGLTIRRLAQHLGVTPMALYWHFKNKDELLAGMADRIWSLVDSTVDPALPWPEQLRALMRSLVGVLRAHPEVTPVLVSIGSEKVPACFPVMEAALTILHQAGYSARRSAELCVHGLRTAIGLVGGEQDGPVGQDPQREAAMRHKRVLIQSLPPDRYPHTVAAAEPLSSCEDPDAYYDFGIELFVAGVVALAVRHQ
jgi:TetR/AcrR family transcriptional regulator, tetracycline repressor protein